ncbi:MAG: hypothetical protein GXO74_06000 [Calditrichaeota bacterium]|nr:hypothetical protein [Calditrichota bacterium]
MITYDEDNKIVEELMNISERMVALLDNENTDGESWDYYCNGQVVKAAVFRNKITATVREVVDEFQIQIIADGRQLLSSCSCGARDRLCKHVISLLYSWVNDREDFLDVGRMVENLDSMEKSELVEVIERILRTDPSKARFLKRRYEDEFDVDEDIDDLF